MCCLFGFYHYGGGEIDKLSRLTNLLAENATVRGTDAAGIACNDRGKLIIHKEAKAAYNIDFKHPESVVCVTGHTRHATQGDKKKNYNNHPFTGACKNLKFALSHNGVLINDADLKKQYHLPKTKIETDSYIAVQLLEKKKQLNVDSVKFMAESIGIRESNPICLSFEKLKPFRLVVLARRQPFFVLRTENPNNFSKWKVEEFK